MEQYFWYSQSQHEAGQMVIPRQSDLQCIINGEVIYYTTCANEKHHGSKHEDMHYLGKGEIYSVNGIIQAAKTKRTK